MSWSVDWSVNIDGQDLTSAWANVLTSISITDKAGSASDSCDLTIDDTGGQARLPSKRAPLLVTINGISAFRGFVEKVQSSGDRSGGRVLKVQGKGYDTGGKAKEPQAFHMDDTDLGAFLRSLADKAGFTIEVDPAFASIKRDYWAANGESLLAMGEALAGQLGGTFKLRGDKAVLAKRGSGLAPGGRSMGAVEADFGPGGNGVRWSITPKAPRAQFGQGKAQWFDRAAASFKTKLLDFGTEAMPAVNLVRSIRADESEADAVLDGRKRDGEHDGGRGSVDLDLTLSAVVEGKCLVRNARPGIDGGYVIDTVKHSADRGGGSRTALDLKQPGDGAGKDTRKAGSASEGFALPKHETMG